MQPSNQCLLEDPALPIEFQHGLYLQHLHETIAETTKAIPPFHSDLETFLKNFFRDLDNSVFLKIWNKIRIAIAYKRRHALKVHDVTK